MCGKAIFRKIRLNNFELFLQLQPSAVENNVTLTVLPPGISTAFHFRRETICAGQASCGNEKQ